MTNKDKVVIYGLLDPYNSKIFYIGKTKNLQKRLLSHKYAAKNKKLKISGKILTSLNKFNKINYTILARPKAKNLNTLEKKYITIYRKKLGKFLLNSREGGEGWQLHFKRRLNLTDKWRKSIQKPVYIYDKILNKEYKFSSIIEAAKFINYKSYGHLTSKLKKDGHYIIYKRFICRYASLRFKMPKRKYKTYIQKTLDNKFIKKYNSYHEVEKAGFTISHVIAVCNKRKNRHTYKGYKWISR